MKHDKGLVGFRGQSLVQRIVGRMSTIADEMIITTNNPDLYRFLGVPLAGDLLPGTGALGGLYTALSTARHPSVGVVACDMPFANPILLKYQYNLLMALGVDLVVPRGGNGLEPFHAVYRRQTCLPYVRSALEAGKRRVDAWFGEVKVRYLEAREIQRFDPDGLAFFNINSPEDLVTAEKMAKDKPLQPDFL
jgi:molybdopterin-guanine dinucleotide biosynthesis protein A